MDLNGRTAVVTGAASGIGLALTERFATAGMSVVMADVEAEKLTTEAKRLQAAGATTRPVVCDVSDPEQVERLRDEAIDAFGAVHVLCNNAGVAPGRPATKTKPGVWQWVVGVNLLGAAYGASAFAPLMVAQGEGHIVNTASEAGLVATPFLGAYHAAKYGVVGLSEALALELAGTGVGVSCLCPELVDTKIFESTRNAPADLGFKAPPPIPMSHIESMMGSAAMAPAAVADAVVEAIHANRFWIITHDISHERIRQRNAQIEAILKPSPKALG